MARSFSATLSTALDQETIDAGFLVAITKPDGTVVRSSTLGVYSATFGGNTYSGSIGFDFSSMTFTGGTSLPSMDGMTAAGASAPFTFDEVAGGMINGSEVQVFLYDYSNGEGYELGSKWYVGQTTLTEYGGVTLDIKSAARRSRQVVLKTYGPGCRHDLGDTGCGVNMSGYTDSVTVQTNADLYTLTIDGPSPMPADDYYANGAIKFTSGDLQGVSRAVRKFVASTGTVYLLEPLPKALAGGETATIHAGCDKTTGAAGCARFSNFLRRLSWDHLPDENLTVPQLVETPPTESTNTRIYRRV